jgi:outer membrane protein assembly factor BamB
MSFRTRPMVLLAALLWTAPGVVASDWPMFGRNAARESEKSGQQGHDWPQFGRDQTRNAVSPETDPPTWWRLHVRNQAGELIEAGRNVLWSSRLGTRTLGDPVVVDGLIWIGTNNDISGKKTEDAGVLLCLEEKTGRERYRYVAPRLRAGIYQDWPHSGLGCSPLIDGNRLWFVTNRCEVVCLDIGPVHRGLGDAVRLWKVDMRKELCVVPFGTPMDTPRRCSIASYQDLIFVVTGNGVGESNFEVAAPEAPSVLCLNKNTGKVVWTDNSPGKGIRHGQWASPLVIEIKGQGQVVVPLGDGWLRAFDARTGRVFWSFDAGGRGTRNNVLATPVFADNRVFVGTGQHPEYGDGPAWVYCIDPTRTGDISPEIGVGPGSGRPNPNSGMIWRFGGVDEKSKRPRFNRTLSNVAVHRGLVIAPDYAGFVHCLDAATGQQYWLADTRAQIRGSPLIIDGKVYVATDGELWIFALDKEKRVLSRIEMDNQYIRCSPIFANGVLYLAGQNALWAIAGHDKDDSDTEGNWPQWRGPERTNISAETGLLKSWPKDGPPLAWKADGLGTGPMSISVAGGRVFALGYKDDHEHLQALDEGTGRVLWSALIGAARRGVAGMEWLSQRSPTVDVERVYAFGVTGQLVCLETANGKELWRKDYAKDFDGKSGPWGFCDYPLVDGDKLICTPGGDKATIVALNKRTGAVIWRCALAKPAPSTYGAIVATELAGMKIYVHQLSNGTVGIAAADGKVLWHHEKPVARMGNVHTAIVHKDWVFTSCGWNTGCGLLKLFPPPNESKVEEIYYARVNIDSWLGSSVLLGDQVHTSCGKCIDFKTGKVLHDLKLARSTMTCAEGLLYHRTGKSRLLLHEITPQGYVERGRFEVPRFEDKTARFQNTAPTWSFPVIAGRQLCLRDQDVLLCYDIAQRRDRPRQPDAIFVPTPQDVVEKMLDLAMVKKTDLVLDLGCGDGRIVVTAAKKYGCKAAGYDLDPECVKLARAKVQEEKVDKLVTIENKDLFTLDLTQADVVALYLLPRLNTKLIPQLEKLKPGARIVSHQFAMEGVRPDRTVRVVSGEDGVEHTLYLWIAPLKKE